MNINLFLIPSSSDSFITFSYHLRWTQKLKINKLVPPPYESFLIYHQFPTVTPHHVTLLYLVTLLLYVFPPTSIFILPVWKFLGDKVLVLFFFVRPALSTVLAHSGHGIQWTFSNEFINFSTVIPRSTPPSCPMLPSSL